ncbi:hypothetical protein C8F04DRAFT_1258203 [Mycena alexandri]|uniref:Uncharacterized protein n=1 Tax=Mycena alexandri TaxID=1745969 RepID=A0AAD6SYN9_9AGAR|nr:hypothetical protein C8F04DRAFT_1258203 [Mycena alexandri]
MFGRLDVRMLRAPRTCGPCRTSCTPSSRCPALSLEPCGSHKVQPSDVCYIGRRVFAHVSIAAQWFWYCQHGPRNAAAPRACSEVSPVSEIGCLLLLPARHIPCFTPPSRTPWLAHTRAERTLTHALPPYPSRTLWLAPMRAERTLARALPLPLAHAVACTHARRAYSYLRLTLTPSRTPWLAPMRAERTLTRALPLAHAVACTHARRAYSYLRLTLTPSRTPWLAPMRAERTLTRALPIYPRARRGLHPCVPSLPLPYSIDHAPPGTRPWSLT